MFRCLTDATFSRASSLSQFFSSSSPSASLTKRTNISPFKSVWLLIAFSSANDHRHRLGTFLFIFTYAMRDERRRVIQLCWSADRATEKVMANRRLILSSTLARRSNTLNTFCFSNQNRSIRSTDSVRVRWYSNQWLDFQREQWSQSNGTYVLSIDEERKRKKNECNRPNLHMFKHLDQWPTHYWLYTTIPSTTKHLEYSFVRSFVYSFIFHLCSTNRWWLKRSKRERKRNVALIQRGNTRFRLD